MVFNFLATIRIIIQLHFSLFNINLCYKKKFTMYLYGNILWTCILPSYSMMSLIKQLSMKHSGLRVTTQKSGKWQSCNPKQS